MTRRTLVLLASVAVLASVLAGCGTTTVTRVVRDKPCATQARMNRCIQDIARYTATTNHLNPSGVRVWCARSGKDWSCLIKAPSFTGPVCGRIQVKTTPVVGLAYPGEGAYEQMSVCDTRFGKA